MSAVIELTSRPRLKRGVKLTYDKTRSTWVLLFPEGVLVPNRTAADVLRLCDGVATVEEITAALGEKYAGVSARDVQDVLVRLEGRRVAEWS